MSPPLRRSPSRSIWVLLAMRSWIVAHIYCARLFLRVFSYESCVPRKTKTPRFPAAHCVEEQLLQTAYEAVAYWRFNSCRNRLKYESNVTKPVVPWKKALPCVSSDTRFNELQP